MTEQSGAEPASPAPNDESADQSTNPGADTQPSAEGRQSDAHTGLSISRQYIKDLSFENPNAPGIYGAFAGEGPELKVSVDIAANPIDDKTHEVVVSLNVNASYQKATAFIMELQYGAQAAVEGEVSEEDLERALMIEVPRHLFPFLRNIVAMATRDGGFPPLLLSPINFHRLHESRRRKAAEAAETA